MTIAAVVLTYNAIENDRLKLLHETIESLAVVPVYVVDNGSTDGTREYLRTLDDEGCIDGLYRNDSGITTSGHGNMLAGRVGAGTEADIIVLSDDDMVWSDGWADTLKTWWKNAPGEVMLTGCHLEPEYDWNRVLRVERYAGICGLVRASTGAASWSFRTADWTGRLAKIVEALPTSTQGYWDVPLCDGIRELGGKVCQLDLAEHAGHGRSTWGNRTVDLYGWDVEPVRQRLRSLR